jgi:short-subunit dehydrogenase
MKVLITGIAQGLGKYLAIELSKRNHIVIGVDIFEKEILDSQIFKVLNYYYKTDLSEFGDIKKLVEIIISECGRIDILINNAGIKSFKLISDYKIDEIDYVFKVNTIAPIILIQQVLNHMEKNGFGRIINISSNASFHGYKTGSIYCSSKASLNLFTQAIKSEITGNNITINSICPATIATEEYISTHKNIRLSKFVRPVDVLSTVERIIHSDLNGCLIPLISFKEKLKYFYMDVVKHFNWFMNF